MFHLGVSNVAMALYACCKSIYVSCCKRMLQVFQLFHTYVSCVSSGCCRSISRCCITYMLQAYICMLQVFYLDVAKLDLDVACVCNGFQVFSGVLLVFQTYVASVSTIFERMLEVFYLDVAKVEMVSHMLHWDHPP